MKALIAEPGGLAVKEISDPQINDCMALVKVIACGICGSDTKIMHGDLVEKGIPAPPLILGHEAVGEVVKVGSKVTTYQVGDIVMQPMNTGREGLNTCLGGFAEYGVVFDVAAWDVAAYGPVPGFGYPQKVLPKGIDPVDAVMIATLREVLDAIKKFQITANESVVVYGCGPVGLTFVNFLHMVGAHPIIALDVVDSKLEDAKRLGADYVINSSDPGYMKKIREICPGGAQSVIDAVGLPDVMNWAMELVADAGKICCYGVSNKVSINLDWSKSPYNWKLFFQQMPNRMDEAVEHQQIINWIEKGAINLKDYISDYYTFDNVLDAFQKFEKKEFSKKCVITF